MLDQANEFLAHLLAGHGLSTVPHQDWLFPDGNLPGIRAYASATESPSSASTIVLTVDVLVDSDSIIKESFAGWGSDYSEALKTAFQNFTTSSLHVFLSAFWALHDPEQVDTESWNISGETWSAFVGPVTRVAAGGAEIPVPGPLLPALETQFRSLTLDRDLYWIRCFHANQSRTKSVTEVLLNNETWPSVEDAISRLPWQESDSYYSSRLFLVLKRAGGSSSHTAT